MANSMSDVSNTYANAPASKLRPPRVARTTGIDRGTTGLRGSDEAAPSLPKTVGRQRRPAAAHSKTAAPELRGVAARPPPQAAAESGAPVTFQDMESMIKRYLAQVGKETDEKLEQMMKNASSEVGSRPPAGAKQSQLLVENQLLEARLHNEERQTEDLRDQALREREAAQELRAELQSYQAERESARKELIAGEARRIQLQEQLRATKDELLAARDADGNAAARCRALEGEIAESDAARRKLQRELDEARDDAETLRSKVKDAARKLAEKEEALQDAADQLSHAQARVRVLEREVADCEHSKAATESALRQLRDRFETEMGVERSARELAESTKRNLELELESKRSEAELQRAEIAELGASLRSAQGTAQDLEQSLAKERERCADMDATNEHLKTAQKRLEATIESQREEIETYRQTIASQDAAASAQRARNAALEETLRTVKEELAGESLHRSGLEQQCAQQEQQIRDDEEARKKLHNLVQELKGNIRVYCRIRPPLTAAEKASHVLVPTKGKLGIEAVQPVAEDKFEPQRWEFQFDQVFHAGSTQEDVFAEVSQVVQSALDGYRVCLFAYGQTGSGKTHTMLGDEASDHSHYGVIPRSVELVFNEAERLRSLGWSYTLKASFLEIYNETIRDLLERGGDTKQHVIKMVDGRTGRSYVSDLTSIEVTSPQQVRQLIATSMQNRATAATRMNERSSRSHSVFRLEIEGVNSETGQNIRGLLNLIDLAGSERLNSSGSVGDRLKETQHINKSLSALGDVIAALANRDKHVPFRNSKLTHLLQDSLGGDCKTLMFVNLSPSETCFSESMCSLRFAQKVNSCDIGTARRAAKIDFSELRK